MDKFDRRDYLISRRTSGYIFSEKLDQAQLPQVVAALGRHPTSTEMNGKTCILTILNGCHNKY